MVYWVDHVSNLLPGICVFVDVAVTARPVRLHHFYLPFAFGIWAIIFCLSQQAISDNLYLGSGHLYKVREQFSLIGVLVPKLTF